MAFFQYLGDADPNTLATQVFGCVFPKGFSVEVTDEYAVAKLRANPRFAEVAIAESDAEEVTVQARRRGRPPKHLAVVETDDDAG
jgi:hypothetical protein